MQINSVNNQNFGRLDATRVQKKFLAENLSEYYLTKLIEVINSDDKFIKISSDGRSVTSNGRAYNTFPHYAENVKRALKDMFGADSKRYYAGNCFDYYDCDGCGWYPSIKN